MKTIHLKEKYDLFQDYWNPRIVAELNGQQIKVVKVKGELVYHTHEHEDELFYVIKGSLKICFENSEKTITEGEMLVVPRGIKHKPIAQEECWLVLFEPSEIKHTGDKNCEQTVSKFKWI
nr:cupin domain-containing protein [uncultured Aquimarina sp.]